jgi:hypothetical protein
VPEAQRVYIEPEPGVDAGGSAVQHPDEAAGNEAEPEPEPEPAGNS